MIRLQYCPEFTSAVKGRNFITPDLKGYYKANGFAIELSSGHIFEKPVFGVTVVHYGVHDTSKGKAFDSEKKALMYIEELTGEDIE